MAEVYKYCDGDTRQDTTITMTESGNLERQFIDAYNTTIDEIYKELTFTASNAPVESPLTVRYTYDYRSNVNYQGFGDTYTVVGTATIPIGQKKVTVQVPIRQELCYTEADRFEDESIRTPL